MKSRLILSALMALLLHGFIVFSAHAGFNEVLDTILAQDELSRGGAAWLVLTGSGALSGEASVAEASAAMAKLLPRIAGEPDKAVTLGEFSLMIMTAWKWDGGLFYTLFPVPRYALRELRFRGVVQGKAFTRMTLTGERGVRIIGRVLSEEEGQS